MPITKLTTLVDKMIMFYETHRWALGALYNGRGFCVLGAASAIMTNEKRLIKDHNADKTYGTPNDTFKGIDLLRRLRRDYTHQMGQSIIGMNDDAIDKRQVIRKLKAYRKLIS